MSQISLINFHISCNIVGEIHIINVRYIKSDIEGKSLQSDGIVRIKSPEEWIANQTINKEGFHPRELEMDIPTPVTQTFTKTKTPGAFTSTSNKEDALEVGAYFKLATKKQNARPAGRNHKEVENLYWESLNNGKNPPLYGADVADTLIKDDKAIWNNRKGADILNKIGTQVTGGAGSYLYYGMWRSTFSWHIEDMDLYGVNYLHYGDSKTWYCVPPSEGHKLEDLVRELYPDYSCRNILRHKICTISPRLLISKGIRVTKTVQHAGELIIVFPHAYHAGFNHGFNIAEASNFGTEAWLEHGKRSRFCTCRDLEKKIVKIDLSDLVKKYQPEVWDSWENGTDLQPHPNDSEEMKNVFKFCTDILKMKTDNINLKYFLENVKILPQDSQFQSKTEKEKQRHLKDMCHDQIVRLKLIRDREFSQEIVEIMNAKRTKSVRVRVILNDPEVIHDVIR